MQSGRIRHHVVCDICGEWYGSEPEQCALCGEENEFTTFDPAPMSELDEFPMFWLANMTVTYNRRATDRPRWATMPAHRRCTDRPGGSV